MSLRRVFFIVASCILVLTVTGCGKGGSSSSSAQVRFMNALVDAGPINVSIGSKSVVSGLTFEGQTLYLGTDSGNQEFKVGIAGGTSTIVDTTLAVSGDTKYTFLVYGTASAPTGPP